MTADSDKIAEARTANYPGAGRSKRFLATCKKVVQRILKMWGALGELLPDLSHVLLVALLNLFLEELLQRPVPEPFLPLLWEIGDEIRDQRTR